MRSVLLALVSLVVGIGVGALCDSWFGRASQGREGVRGGVPAAARAVGADIGGAAPASVGSGAGVSPSRGTALVMASDFEARGYEAAARSAEEAIAAAKEIKNPRERAEFLRGLFLKLAEAGPAKALALMRQLEEGDRAGALLTLAYAWMPESGSAPFGSLIRSYGLEAGLGYQFLKAEPPNLEMAVQWAQALMSGQRSRGSVSLLGAAAREMAKTDPTRAYELGKDLTGWERDRFVGEVAAGWASVDPMAAAEWVGQFPAGSLRDRALLAMMKPWAEKDPASAASAAAALGGGEARAEALQSVAQQWAAQDEARARAWAASLADPSARAAAEAGIWNAKPVGVGLALRTDPSGAVLIGGLMEGGPAARSGQVRENDRIVAVGVPGQGLVDIRGMKLDQVVGMLRGAKGSAVMLQVTGADGAPRTVSVVRDDLKLK
ncbi:MAG: PDZ domain-containing protein [Verrucomicrobiae bacterium]|nr:PDZ domain-containing protein [Verrucomicrobiae bacterium]